MSVATLFLESPWITRHPQTDSNRDVGSLPLEGIAPEKAFHDSRMTLKRRLVLAPPDLMPLIVLILKLLESDNVVRQHGSVARRKAVVV